MRSPKHKKEGKGLMPFSPRGIQLHLLLMVILVIPIVSLSFVVSELAAKAAPLQSTGYFTTLAPGSPLPSDSDCTTQVQYTTWEPRPSNTTANNSVPTASQEAQIQNATWSTIGIAPTGDTLLHRVTGNFTGTTDEIYQWTACKWGIDEDIVRAEAFQESSWYQSHLGDYANGTTSCPPGTYDGTGCYHSYGILQVKYDYVPFTWPMSRDDTAFDADYAYSWIRDCYEGHVTYLGSGYQAGDLWGCIGFYYSGHWYDSGAISYIAKVQNWYYSKPWLQAGFPPPPTPTPTTQLSSTPTGTPTPTPVPPTSTPTPTTIVDTTPPIVSITNPLNGSIVKRGSTVIITANASDNVGVTKVDFSVNSSLLCSDTTSPYSCAWSVPRKRNVTYTITAKASDASGNTATNAVTVTAK